MSNVEKIRDFCNKYGVARSEVWEVRGGKNYAISHAAIERIAFQHNVTFKPPVIVEADSMNKIATILVTGKLGDFEQWSIGEAAPSNNKNDYPFAMAEKRAKDRVVLKLLNIHGILYSEEELGGSVNGENSPASKPTLAVVKTEDEAPKTASQMTPAQLAAAKQAEEDARTETEIKAFQQLSSMVKSCPTVAALDVMVNGTDWKTAIKMAHEIDKASLRKEYRERRIALSYSETN